MPVSCALDDELGFYRITLSGQRTDRWLAGSESKAEGRAASRRRAKSSS